VETYRAGKLDALGDPTRRAIFELLGQGPRSVGEIAAELPVSRPAVSQHLKVLLTAGLVTQQAAGTRRVYRIDADGVGEVRAYFDRFWTQALEAFRIAAEAPPPPPDASDPRFDHDTEEQP
jgi:DNA-binding transcriptional ArsR family regulator